MKKISLSSVKDYLSRDEKKQITGGSGGSNTCHCHGMPNNSGGWIPGGSSTTYYGCGYCFMICAGNFTCS
jgi:hypothetical protein